MRLRMRLRIAGLVVCRQRPGTAKGITFLLLADEVGLVNVIVYPDLYEEHRHVVRGEPFLLIEGRLQHEGATINVLAEKVLSLDVARAVFPMATTHPPAAEAIDVDIVTTPARPEPARNTLTDLRERPHRPTITGRAA